MTGRGRYLDGPFGQVHVREAGHGPLVVLLHQVPRSTDEFRDVLPLLAARGLHALAIDLPGYGASAPAVVDSIEAYADAVQAALAQLTDEPYALVGHHTGGVVAVEVAARAGEGVRALVLSSTPYVDAEHRGRPAHGVDSVTPDDDGSHLLALWRGRQGFYPACRRDLLERFVRDALGAGTARSAGGHAAVRAYRMEERLPLVRARTVLVAATADPYAAPHVPRLAAALPQAQLVSIEGGMVPLPDQLPEQFAAVVVEHVLDHQ